MSDRRRYVDVVTVLALKDFKVRYRNSALGFIWALLNPLAYMIILTLVFSFLFHITIQNYAAWLLIGLLIWRFFQNGTNGGLASIIANPSLVSRVYLPRYMIVLSNSLANLMGATLEFVALFPLLLILGVSLTYYVLLIPIIVISEFCLVFALSLSLSALYLKYRDFNQIWDIVLQLGFFLTPIVYDSSLVPARYRLVYSLNPVAVLVDVTRGILIYKHLPTIYQTLGLLGVIFGLLIVGLLIFRRLETKFAEEL